MFDPNFARAFVDGRFSRGLDHAEALRRVRCPLLVLHADWHRSPTHGLVGAIDDDDAARIRELVPHSQYQRIAANHLIHMSSPGGSWRRSSRSPRPCPKPAGPAWMGGPGPRGAERNESR
jgi:pimeloyl-ACP methyl ester carboxylesterase